MDSPDVAAAAECRAREVHDRLRDARRLVRFLEAEHERSTVTLQALCAHDRGTVAKSDGDYHRPRRWRECAVCGIDVSLCAGGVNLDPVASS